MVKRLITTVLSLSTAVLILVPSTSGEIKHPPQAAAPSTTRTQHIGIVPFYSPEKIWYLYKPFMEYLRRQTGIPWELKLYQDHAAIIEGICSGDISLAYLGPAPFHHAYEACRVKPLLVSIGQDGKPYYRSLIVTSVSRIHSLQDVKGEKFAFFRNSTASYFLPKRMLEDEGITMEMVDPVFYSSQDRIIEGLLKDEAAAGGVKESLYEKFKGMNIRVLKASQPLPHFTFCSLPSLDPDVEKSFKDALLRLRPLRNSRDRETVKDWDPELQYGFMPAPGDYLQKVHELRGIFKTD